MRLFYNSSNTNFGDHLNAWLWPRLIPEMLERDDDTTLIAVGSLLQADISRLPGHKIIFGTGSGYGNPPSPEIAKSWSTYAVRGPLTAELYGFEPRTAITDGAWLINRLPEYATEVEKGEEVVFIPHWSSAQFGQWETVCASAGLSYIDPLDDGPSILNRIAKARLAIVESLHGAIFADYFGTPWIPVSSASRILHFKWEDWCRSLDLPYRSLPLPPSDFVDHLLQRQSPSHDMPELRHRDLPPLTAAYTPIAKKNRATLAYRSKTRAKAYLRTARNRVLDHLRRHRETAFLRGWNDEHRKKLADYLSQITEQEAFLSDRRIRQQRIDQLNAAFDTFVSDWK